jgi:hypothetical protein
MLNRPSAGHLGALQLAAIGKFDSDSKTLESDRHCFLDTYHQEVQVGSTSITELR